jgi:hypothetical protein
MPPPPDAAYNDVASRIVTFREKHPEGSLQPVEPTLPVQVLTLTDEPDEDGRPVEAIFLVYTAAAYRSPDDKRPGIGVAYERFPGATPYTRDSELQNAETAAWGRAIVAAMAADVRSGVASAEEVTARAQGGGASDTALGDVAWWIAQAHEAGLSLDYAKLIGHARNSDRHAAAVVAKLGERMAGLGIEPAERAPGDTVTTRPDGQESGQ